MPWMRVKTKWVFKDRESIAKLKKGVTPAKAGVQKFLKRLDSKLSRE
jgi:hypothetical protein